MKRGPLLLSLVLCWAGGALVHHFTESPASAPGAHPRAGGLRPADGARARGAAFSRRDPEGMAETLQAMMSDGASLDWRLLEERLAAMAPEDYLLVIRELSGKDKKFLTSLNDVKIALLERAAAADAHALLAFAEEEDGGYTRLSAVARLCFAYAPVEVIATIMKRDETDPFSRAGRLMSEVVEGSDPARTLKAAEAAGALFYVGGGGFAGLLSLWADRDGPAAMAFAAQHPSLLKAVLIPWAGNDVDAAIAWLQASPEREELVFGKSDPTLDSNGTVSSAPLPMDLLCQEYAKKHPHEAERLADQVTDRLFFRQCQAANMAGEPLETTAAWLRTLPEDVRAHTCHALLVTLKDTDPEKAFALCRQFPALLATSGGDDLLAAEARMHPAEMAEFVQSSAPVDIKDMLSEKVLSSWLKLDRPAAMRYLQTQPPSEQNGSLLLEGSQLLQYETREAAQAYAINLPEPALRLGALLCILRSDFQGDTGSPEAMQWIETVPDHALRAILWTTANDLPRN